MVGTDAGKVHFAIRMTFAHFPVLLYRYVFILQLTNIANSTNGGIDLSCLGTRTDKDERTVIGNLVKSTQEWEFFWLDFEFCTISMLVMNK
jgi:hypothetical protein